MRLAVLAILILLPVTVSAEITGQLRIIDGDTIEIADQRIRLYGIDAPEAPQRCIADNKCWQCGRTTNTASGPRRFTSETARQMFESFERDAADFEALRVCVG